MSYDNRKPGEASIAAWREASGRARWTFEEAREAVLDHYANSAEFITPGHITQRIRHARSQPARNAQLKAAPRQPADPRTIRETMRSICRELGWPDRRQAAHSPALLFPCPHCDAPVGRPCARQLASGHRRGQWVAINSIHPSRLELAEETA